MKIFFRRKEKTISRVLIKYVSLYLIYIQRSTYNHQYSQRTLTLAEMADAELS